MDDRELLERAAKAANQERSVAGDLWSNARGQLWNPLTDDGDALRLAVKLGMKLYLDPYGDCGVQADVGEVDIVTAYEPSGDDSAAATRRAIVRAAAAMAQEGEAK